MPGWEPASSAAVLLTHGEQGEEDEGEDDDLDADWTAERPSSVVERTSEVMERANVSDAAASAGGAEGPSSDVRSRPPWPRR